jgi:hypothetical protein
MNLSTAFLETARTYGAESVEMEWRLSMVHPSLVKAMTTTLQSSPAFEDIGTVETTEEYSEGDCRRITTKDSTDDVQYLYKRRMAKATGPGPATVTVSLERYGQSPGDQTPFPVYRKKTRRKWRWRCWEVHITEFYTNDSRYTDSDTVLHDIELEFQPTADEIYMYPISTIIDWGHDLIQGLEQAALISTSSEK